MSHFLKNKKFFKLSPRANKTAGALIVFFIFISVSVFLSNTMLNTNKKMISTSELRFKEFSNNKKIEGSILPASCGSYPDFGTSHAGDIAGHCAGTCPAGSSLVADSITIACYYPMVYDLDGYAVGNTYHAYVWDGCPVYSPFGIPYGLYYTSWGQAPDPVTNICTQYCNGTPIYPHLGQSCPPPPPPTPTVNINFN